jgi:hypothetical protein
VTGEPEATTLLPVGRDRFFDEAEFRRGVRDEFSREEPDGRPNQISINEADVLLRHRQELEQAALQNLTAD